MPRLVYPEREDSQLMMPFARGPARGWLLEIGCGAGRASLEAARQGWRVVATDRNPDALSALRTLARAEGLDVHPVRTDFSEGLRRFARILANPPYLPISPGDEDPDPWVDLALNGGPDGTGPTDEIVAHLAAHLDPEGRAYLLTSSLQDQRALDGIFGRWRARHGPVAAVAQRTLEGETLEVVELALRTAVATRLRPNRAARPRPRQHRGTDTHRPVRT